MNPEYVKKQIEKHKIGSIDLKYADLVGNWYHITFPARRLEHVLKNGILKYATSESAKRIEFRAGGGTCNYYLAMSALLMAGLDGIKNGILPDEANGFGPYDDNYNL